MKKQTTYGSQMDKSLILLGFTSIAILFLIYSRFETIAISDDTMLVMQRIAITFYVIVFLAFTAIALGLYKFHKRKVTENNSNLLETIAKITYNNKSRKIFVTTFILYGLFFSLTSGILVYQPDVVFSYHYDAIVPSMHITPCCDEPGYMPKIVVYLTEHIGLQIIPINLVLQIVVSYLVALNTSIAIAAISTSKKSGGLSTIGATTGLFIACPTCVGSFLSIFIGSASAVAMTVVVTQIQTLFIAITIPILLATPFIIARRIRSNQGENSEIN